MKFPLSWLKDYIDLDLSPDEIAEKLTSLGIEVEDVQTVAMSFSGVVVGRVTHVEKHPNADKLCVATVTDGTESFKVVCGAPNCRVGLRTAYAKVGAVLRDSTGKSFEIKKNSLRGVDSCGMLCSSKELQLSEESDKILEFSDYLKEGADLAELYADLVFDISLTPNLAYCANIIGIARELSAATGKPLRLPDFSAEENAPFTIQEMMHVRIEDRTACPRYACRVVSDLVMGPSPEWMQQRLIASGMRPVNVLVDITNYVLLETGHPLHAFDYDRLQGNQIIVRSAADGERFTTLDNKERILSTGDLLICDGRRPVALGGIMGGLNSEVHEDTKTVLIESAYFNPSTIRRTSKRLGILTEGSWRFERGADPNQVLNAVNRSAELMRVLAQGKIARGVIEVKANEFPEKPIACRFSRIHQLLGLQISLSEVESLFRRLGMPYHWDGRDKFTVTVPTFRTDISQEVDLIEEVARFTGYKNIPLRTCAYHASPVTSTPIFLFEREMRNRLVAEGLQEFITCDLIGPTLLGKIREKLMPDEAVITVLNPTSIEQSILRTSLMPGLLEVAKNNYDHQNLDLAGFEIGRIHFKANGEYKEQTMAGVVLMGQAYAPHWQVKPNEVDFFQVKGILENLLDSVGVRNVQFRPSKNPTLHPGRQAAILSDELELGSMGEVHPAILRRLDIPSRVYFAEMNLYDLLKVRKQTTQMRDLPLYPASERDWTVTVPDTLSVQTLFDLISDLSLPLLEKVSLLDIYRSDRLGSGFKNVTLRFVYRDLAKTIEQATVDAEHSRLLTEVVRMLKI